MTRYRLIILIYIGILYYFKNVLADVLNLQNIILSGFFINNTTKDSCTYTEVAPKDDKAITKVLDGNKILWESDGNFICMGVMLITKTDYEESLLYIELLRSNNYSVKYFCKKDDGFIENDKDTFDNKLSEMSDSSSSDSIDFGYGSGQGSEESIEELYEYEEENQEDESSELLNEDDYQQREDNNNEQDETPENLVTEFEGTDVFLNKRGSSLRKEPDYQCDRSDRECCNQKRVLDIIMPEENKRVRYEYELNDGVPTMTVTSKKNKRVTMVYENQHKIWSGDGDKKLVLLSAHSFYGEYRLLELFYMKNKKNHNIYYKKINNKWQQVNVDDFVNYYNYLKSTIKHIGNISLNVSNVKNADLFFEKYERNERFKATTYFPLTGYHLTQVGDGDKLIWSSNSRRCIAAIVITEDEKVRFLKLEILSTGDTAFNKFYKKDANKYVKIDENDFEQYINNENPVIFEAEIPAKEDEPVFEHGPTDKETKVQTKKKSEDDYEPENINLENFKVHYTGEQPPKDTTDQITGTKVDYDGYEPTELDLEDLAQHNVSKGNYKNVKYKSVLPQNGQVFNLLKVGENRIWRGNSNKYCDFVRMFYHENEPKLGFIKINENGNEYDKYFVEDTGIWKFVTVENFKLVFELYAEYEANKLAHQESTKSVKTDHSDEGKTDTSDRSQAQEEQTHGPYRGRQPDIKQENSPLAFFVFDINDEEQSFQS